MANLNEDIIKNASVLVPLNYLETMLRNIIREEINAKNEKLLEEKFLSPEETCKLFLPNISKPTLESYSQKNLLQKHFLGGRTWFKYSEVIEAIKKVKKYARNMPIEQKDLK